MPRTRTPFVPDDRLAEASKQHRFRPRLKADRSDPLFVARAIRRAMEERGISPTAAGRSWGLGSSGLDWLRLLDLPQAIQDLLQRQEISLSLALTLARMRADSDLTGRVAALVEANRNPRLTSRQIMDRLGIVDLTRGRDAYGKDARGRLPEPAPVVKVPVDDFITAELVRTPEHPDTRILCRALLSYPTLESELSVARVARLRAKMAQKETVDVD